MVPNWFERQPEETAQSYLERIDYESKRDHGGNASYEFVLVSLVLFLITRTKLLAISVLLYFFVGVFVAAILSVPTWLLKISLARRITETQARGLRFYWMALEWSYNIGVTWFLFRIYKGFIN
jgi:Flp pilus assembly protein TadB